MTVLVGWASVAQADSITLAWDPSSGSVSGYKVHVGQQSGSYTLHYDVGGATSFTYSNAVAGQRYCFAVSAYVDSTTEGPNSSEICGYSNMTPTLQNPGNRSSAVGQATSLQLVGSDPDGQPLTYSATGLPPGLSVGSSTGFISGSGSTAGTFSVTARAFDGVLTASQTFTWTMTAPAPSVDTTAPAISIGSPTSSSSYTTSSSSIALSGTSSDNVGVTQVTWVSDRAGNGTASGTTTWSTPVVTLQTGTTNFTVYARDAAGNQSSDSLTVTYDPPTTAPSTTVTLSAQISSNKGRKQVRLAWTSASWPMVDVYKNGTRIAVTSNDGAYNDSFKNGGTYNYKICSSGSSTVCSNTITVYF